MSIQSSFDSIEVQKFSSIANHWWDIKGPFKTLHDINPVRLAFIKKHCDLASKHILDVGCGGGILSEAMAQEGGIVSGIDASEEGIMAAKQHANDTSLPIQYTCSLVEDYEGSFDIITCLELIEHVANPQLIIEHCQRLLKPKGLLFLSTLNRTTAAYLKAIVAAEYVLKLLPKQTHDYQKFIKPSEFMAMARMFDLSLVDMSGLSYNPFNGHCELNNDVSVNYLLALRKE